MKRLTIGILAHVDAGKTTLSEALLYETGAIRSMGRVDHGDAHLDTDDMEKARGITIFSKMARFAYGDAEYVLLDTPGHADFTAEMERTLSVLDYAILVISGIDGVQGHTRTLWKLLQNYNVPCILFINKMDVSHRGKEELLSHLQEKLADACMDFGAFYGNAPMSDRDKEHIALCSEPLLDAFLNTGVLDQKLLVEAIAKRQIFPVLLGSALKVQGVKELLRLMQDYMRQPSWGQDFAARCFKIGRDEKGNRLTYLKILGGAMHIKDNLSYTIPFAGTDGDTEEEGAEETCLEKVNQIRLYSGERYECVDRVEAGEVCVILGLSRS